MNDEQATAIHTTLATHFPDTIYCILVRPQSAEEGCLETTISAIFPVLTPTYRAFIKSGIDLKKAFRGVIDDVNALLMKAIDSALVEAEGIEDEEEGDEGFDPSYA